MEKAKIFENGRSQAVRLPKKYRFNSEEVVISRLGNAVMLVEKDKVFETFLNGLDSFTDDVFCDGRADVIPSVRDSL